MMILELLVFGLILEPWDMMIGLGATASTLTVPAQHPNTTYAGANPATKFDSRLACTLSGGLYLINWSYCRSYW